MTDTQALLAIVSTVISGILGMIAFWMREAIAHQKAYITQLNSRVATLERREQERERRIEHLESENNLLTFRLRKAINELAKLNPDAAKVLGETEGMSFA